METEKQDMSTIERTGEGEMDLHFTAYLESEICV